MVDIRDSDDEQNEPRDVSSSDPVPIAGQDRMPVLGIDFHLRPGVSPERRTTLRDPIRSPEIPHLIKDARVQKLYFSLPEAASIIGISEEDVLHYAGLGRLRLHCPVPGGIEMRPFDWRKHEMGSQDFGLELLSISTRDCRALEFHGHVKAEAFGLGWRIGTDGHAFSQEASGFNETMVGLIITWACFDEAKRVAISVTKKEVFVFSFDIESFLNKTYQAAEEASKEVLIAPAGHEIESADLTTMRQAARKFWGPVDPRDKETYPKTAAVKDWLMQHRFTDNTADAAVTILRPGFAQTGTRRANSSKRGVGKK